MDFEVHNIYSVKVINTRKTRYFLFARKYFHHIVNNRYIHACQNVNIIMMLLMMYMWCIYKGKTSVASFNKTPHIIYHSSSIVTPTNVTKLQNLISRSSIPHNRLPGNNL